MLSPLQTQLSPGESQGNRSLPTCPADAPLPSNPPAPPHGTPATPQRRLERRLTLLAASSAGVALLLACTTLVTLEHVRERRTLAGSLAIASGVMLAAGFAGCLFTRRLRRQIAEPLVQLTAIASRVAAERDYTLRVARSPHGDSVELTDAFNDVLAQIQSRDESLRAAHDQLEHRINERTAELAYERDQLRVLLDSSPDVIYFKDLQSRFVRVSRSKAMSMLRHVPGLRERLGLTSPGDKLTPDLLIGMSDADIYTREHASRALADEQRIIETGQPLVGCTEKLTHQDGTVRWALTNKMAWRDKDGRVIGTLGISKDITKLKLAEEKLEQMHRQLLDASRAAGMAEVATGVLHNVGNVLNSVNVSTTLVADTVRHSKCAFVGKLAALLQEHAADLPRFLTQDPRGKVVQPYLTTLAEDLAREQTSVLLELDHLRKNVDHIKEIVAMQQSYARTSGVIEAISIPDLVEDALRMNAGSLSRHDIDIARDYRSRPVVALEKHKVLQVLVNLIRNAKYACDESGRTDKLLTIRIETRGEQVAILVIDNGVGIPPENLARIFNHGFTTRAQGHGFGLHSGANAAKEMGGSLVAHSDGPGLGATFTLTLPFKPAEARS